MLPWKDKTRCTSTTVLACIKKPKLNVLFANLLWEKLLLNDWLIQQISSSIQKLSFTNPLGGAMSSYQLTSIAFTWSKRINCICWTDKISCFHFLNWAKHDVFTGSDGKSDWVYFFKCRTKMYYNLQIHHSTPFYLLRLYIYKIM